jgi:hypothetical protein
MDDDALFDQEDEEPEVENSTIRQIREHARKLEKELKAARKELEDLRAYREQTERERTVASARTIFEQVGLNPKWAELYLKAQDGAEPTPESVRTWAQEYGLAVPEPERETAEQPASEPAFVPTQPAAAAASTQAPMTWKEFAELHRQDPGRAVREAQQRGIADVGEVGVLSS